ncbi:MAG: DegT/DnrJ/EryC1/StrS family aminotransferase [bacterium]|nr:DegT/DnrJ/EryC1/StrS family aminotransferase [bacterium]
MGKKSQLAILGGEPVRTRPFPAYRTIGAEEKRAVNEVLDSGNLSQFLGTWSPGFHGGPRVQKLESEWANYFGVKHAVSVNSATSGLYAALGASGVGPGDEVIVSPYTMSCSAVGPLIYGATPVFADIDPSTYCISAETIRRVLTPRTRAILAVDLFGHPADFDAINQVAQEHDLIVIEDAAQAPGAKYKGRWAGCLAHMGVFSLNYHKTIHSGEGGVVVTNDDELADRLSLIRNHGETVVEDKGATHLNHLIGYNYRMTEIEAAIASAQLEKLEPLTRARIEAAEFLSSRWSQVPGLLPARVEPDCRHAYYVLAVQYDAQKMGVSRERFVEAVKAEGVPLSAGYVKPLYMQPIYQQRAFRCGANCDRYSGSVSYEKGICPTVEAMHYEKLLYTMLIHADLSQEDLEDVAFAVEKVALEAGSLAA